MEKLYHMHFNLNKERIIYMCVYEANSVQLSSLMVFGSRKSAF